MRHELGYRDGIGATLATIASLVLVTFAVRGDELADMYRDLPELPPLAAFVLHPAWRYGLPLALGVATVAAHLRPRRGLLPLIGAAGLLVTAITLVGAWQPIFALAGNIRG